MSYSAADGSTKAFDRNPIRIDLGRWFAPFWKINDDSFVIEDIYHSALGYPTYYYRS